MAEAFKHQVGPAAVERIVEALVRVGAPVDGERLRHQALAGLEDLELKDRVRHLGRVVRGALPVPWPEVCRILVAALPPESHGAVDLTGHFWVWPFLQVVEDHAGDPEHSLPALREMTSRWSAEFAVRPLLDRFPAEAWAQMRRWAGDPSVHVRRLASEGSRSRLPWGARLRTWSGERALPILDALRLDAEPYVRRSVANHLGDISKVDRALALEVAGRWWAGGDRERRVVRHGLRTLAKAGDSSVLALIGGGGVACEVRCLEVAPAQARVGEVVEVRALIRALTAGQVRIDLRWEWPGARGGWAGKDFRGGDCALAVGELWAFSTRLSTKPVSTRPTRPGVQRVVLRVAGEIHGPVEWRLDPAE